MVENERRTRAVEDHAYIGVERVQERIVVVQAIGHDELYLKSGSCIAHALCTVGGQTGGLKPAPTCLIVATTHRASSTDATRARRLPANDGESHGAAPFALDLSRPRYTCKGGIHATRCSRTAAPPPSIPATRSFPVFHDERVVAVEGLSWGSLTRLACAQSMYSVESDRSQKARSSSSPAKSGSDHRLRSSIGDLRARLVITLRSRRLIDRAEIARMNWLRMWQTTDRGGRPRSGRVPVSRSGSRLAPVCRWRRIAAMSRRTRPEPSFRPAGSRCRRLNASTSRANDRVMVPNVCAWKIAIVSAA